MLIDPELGIATDYLDTEHRVKASTIKKNVLRRKMELDSLGEELRVLYVAMTRAKEKLIMTGTDRNLGKTLEKYSQIPLAGGQIPYTILSGAASYLDWVLMCTGPKGNGLRIQVKEIPVMEFVGEELGCQVQKKSAKGRFGGTGSESGIRRQFRKTSAGSSWLCLSLCRGCDAAYKDVGIGTEKNGTAHR